MSPARAFALAISLSMLGLLIGAPVARGQGAPQMQVEIDQDTVGVGEIVRLEVTATSADAMPSDPRLGGTPGFIVRGQNASPTQTHISINGSRMDRYSLTVQWALEAQRVGAFSVGPASVAVGGARFSSPSVKIRVVPAGQAPARRHRQPSSVPSPFQSPFGFSPFDPWKALIPGMDGMDQAPAPSPPAPSIDPKLALDAARGAVYFLHSTLDKTTAVVGEQVTFSVFEYLDITASDVAISEDARDAQVPDFVKHPLLPEDQDAVLAGYASIGGRTWVVKLVRRWALFPLKTGDLAIEPMRELLVRPRSVANQARTTEALQVHVTEPPMAGRPPGYMVGDVGHFSLAAQVQPRAIDEGGAVGVHVEISGTGNLPATIAPAAREGVEWLTPETHDDLGPAGHDVWGGKRSFDFVVRLKKSGAVDLGSLAVPFWDPDQRRYDVARAALGTVNVKAAPGGSAAAEPAQEVLPGLPTIRDALQGPAPRRRYADDSPVFWLGGVAAWPLAFGIVVAGRSAGRRLGRAWRGRRASPVADLKDRVALAHAACGGKDAREADAAIARALEAATVVHAGVNVRAAVGGEVVDRLERAGVAHNAAATVADLLRECEAARFSPDATDVLAARDRWVRAQGAIRGLERRV
ncbi:MAG TPA: BatD family protein [Polyangiaceae bacterium]|nr:BatD family protein [Polyangiaceae bacterium]